MQEIINVLKLKYGILCSNCTEIKQKMNEQSKEILMVKEALEHPETFDDSDIDELMGMLCSEDQAKLESIKIYLKLFEKFKNQPQIIRARNTYEDIKKKIIEYFETEYNELTTLFKEAECIIAFIKNMSGKIKTYTDETYIEATDLYSLTDLLRNSDVTVNVIEFYKRILHNNVLIYTGDENNIVVDKIDLDLNKYIGRLRRINKSLMNDSLHDDELILEFLNNLLDTDKKVNKDVKLCDHVIELLINQFGNSYGKKVLFLAHLNYVEIDYVEEQTDFIHYLIQFYSDKIVNNHNKDIIKRNTEFIDIITGVELFDDMNLLSDVFKETDLNSLDMLKIITGVIYQNEQKYKIKKQKVKQ